VFIAARSRLPSRLFAKSEKTPRLIEPAEQQTGASQRVIEPAELPNKSRCGVLVEALLALPESSHRLALFAKLRQIPATENLRRIGHTPSAPPLG
jgi:hypothetical protein